MLSDRQSSGHFAVCDVNFLSHGQLYTGCMLAARGTIPCTTTCSRPCMSPEYGPGEHGRGWWEEGGKREMEIHEKGGREEESGGSERGVEIVLLHVQCQSFTFLYQGLPSCIKGNLFCFKGTPNPVVERFASKACCYPTHVARQLLLPAASRVFFAQRIIV